MANGCYIYTKNMAIKVILIICRLYRKRIIISLDMSRNIYLLSFCHFVFSNILSMAYLQTVGKDCEKNVIL